MVFGRDYSSRIKDYQDSPSPGLHEDVSQHQINRIDRDPILPGIIRAREAGAEPRINYSERDVQE